MQRPLCVSPMLVLLAARAHARVAGSLGMDVAADPWCGLSSVLPRTVSEGAGRTPSTWLSRWPAGAAQAFWSATRSPLIREAFRSTDHPGMEALVHAVNAARRRPTVWGDWPNPPCEVDMGLAPSPHAAACLPDNLRVGGLVVDPGSMDAPAKSLLEALACSHAEAWWVAPPSRGGWHGLDPKALQLIHRLGVSLWLDAPVQGEWMDYQACMVRLAQNLARMQGWDQWVWPVCDLIEQSFEDVIATGRPASRQEGPWAWEGRCRNPDWRKTRAALWAAVEQALGGEGSLDEILVASVLWQHDLLRP